MHARNLALVLAPIAALAVGCGGDVELFPANCSASPVFNLLLPTEGQVVTTDTVAVELEVSNFSIVDRLGEEPAPCEGHFHAFLNDSVSIVPTTRFELSLESVEPGPVELVIEVHNNDHSLIEDIAPIRRDFVYDPEGGDQVTQAVPVTAEAVSLVLLENCDPGGESDFFINVKMSDATGDEEALIDESLDYLLQTSSSVTNLEGMGILATGSIAAVTGQRLLIRVSFYENDPDGPQVSIGRGYTYVYDQPTGCWSLEGETDCLGDVGDIDVNVLRLTDDTSAPCDAQLRWRFSAEAPR